MSSFTDLLICFAVGGALCTVGQLLISLTRLTPARVLVIFVTAGAILTGIGVYEPLVKLAGAGATVPLTGFGYTLAKGAIEGAGEKGLLGALTGGIKATAAGITAAIVFGYVIALLFRPKTKL
ncbi:MAG: stage V sporulation protein AE [Clostridia bacterium]|jgi:stage V sporulation protein AE|nr:stage V sporulation protein AE [Clostridia bacterium]MBQ4448254.1 stage V sporulation protein AE [Clostridia bacterium]